MVAAVLPSFLRAQDHTLVEEFLIHSNSEFVHNGRRHKTYELVEGSNLVFEYSSNNAGDIGNGSIADTKFSFQVPANAESFDYSGDNLNECGAVYVQFCLCQDEGISIVVDGSIKGEKRNDDSWVVHLDAIAFGRKTQHKYHFQKTLVYKILLE